MSIRLLATLLSSTAAYADEVVHFDPVPAWVVVLPIPPRAASPADEAMSLRLFDRQMRFDTAGDAAFVRSIVRVGSADALAAAGQISLQWQPATDRAAVHRLVIHRDGAIIDVLKRGQTFTILRREDGLAAARIDGRLTATLQISDLRVGDEVEMAATIVSARPLLAGHAEDILAFQGGAGVDRFHLLYRWPAARRLRWQVGEAMPAAVTTTRGGESTLTIDRANFVMPVLPRDAPKRFVEIGAVQLGDFPDWPSVSLLFADLYARASATQAGSPLTAEIARIAAASSDPRRRTELALQAVQREVRYFADLQGLGNYRPAAADRVWADRFGDCKGKAVLLIAMLRGLGIEAVPALVSASRGDGLDKSLPMPARFDHVIVRATVAGKVYWLDGTRSGDTALDRIDVPAFEWALPVTALGSGLEALVATPPSLPTEESRLDLDASAGILVPAKASGSVVWRGDTATASAAAWAFIPVAQRDAWLREFWKGRHKSVEVATARFDSDPASGTATISFTGTANMEWSIESYRNFEPSGSQIGFDLSPERAPGRFADAPIDISPLYEVRRRSIILPGKGAGFTIDGETIDATVAGISLKRNATLTGGRFEMVATTRTAAHEIAYAAGKAADAATDRIFEKRLFVKIGQDYPGTAADKAAVAAMPARKDATPLDTVMAEVTRLMAGKDLPAALKLMDGSAVANAKSARYHTGRAWLYLELKREAEGDAALDQALAIDPLFREALMLRADRLAKANRYDDALIVIDRLILLDPQFTQAYVQRSNARRLTGNLEGAVADAKLALDREPDNVNARFWRCHALLKLGRHEEALADANALVAARDNAEMRALRGNIHAILGRDAEAKADLAKSIALAPSSDAYVTRIQFDLSGDAKAALADVLGTIAVDPGRGIPDYGLRRAMTASDGAARILAAYAAGLAKAPDDDNILRQRTNAQEAAGLHEAALAQHDKWVAAAKNRATALNNRCWYRATNNLDLPKALADCDAAIALEPSPGRRDSRALVYLRLGDLVRARAEYDAVLAEAPTIAPSLYGRGLVRQRQGDTTGAAADLAAARAVNKRIDARFGWMGLQARP